MNLNEYFVKNGVYKLNNYSEDSIFICMSTAGDTIGKLVQFDLHDGIYEKTNNTYFLNSYMENDIKSLFVKRENYEMLGMLEQNFVINEDETKVLRG